MAVTQTTIQSKRLVSRQGKEHFVGVEVGTSDDGYMHVLEYGEPAVGFYVTEYADRHEARNRVFTTIDLDTAEEIGNALLAQVARLRKMDATVALDALDKRAEQIKERNISTILSIVGY